MSSFEKYLEMTLSRCSLTFEYKFNIAHHGSLTLLNLGQCVTSNICPRNKLGTLGAWKRDKSMSLNWFVYMYALPLSVISDQTHHAVLYYNDDAKCKLLRMVPTNDDCSR